MIGMKRVGVFWKLGRMKSLQQKVQVPENSTHKNEVPLAIPKNMGTATRRN